MYIFLYRHVIDVCEELYDAIVTDPPYGFRAAARKAI